jgi:hypothetical protein
MNKEKVFRVIVAGNLVLIAFSWFPWFEGTAYRPGVVDHLLGGLRLGGFRADAIWLFVSTLFIFVALFPFLIKAKKDRSARINALLCIIEILAFCSFVYRVLTSGVFDFG